MAMAMGAQHKQNTSLIYFLKGSLCLSITPLHHMPVFLCWALRSPMRKTFKNHNVYLLCVKVVVFFFVACFFRTGTSPPFIILSPDFESKRVWAFFLWWLTLVKRGVWILPQLAPSLRASHRCDLNEEPINLDHISEVRSSGLDTGQTRLMSNQPEQILSDISFLHLIPETGLCPLLV